MDIYKKINPINRVSGEPEEKGIEQSRVGKRKRGCVPSDENREHRGTWG